MLQNLVEGRLLLPETPNGLAARYLIAVVGFDGIESGCAGLAEAAGPGVLAAPLDRGVMLLVPDLDAARTLQVVERLTGHLGGRGWLVTARRPATELVQGVAEAADVLKLVLAGRRPSGAYTISDVLVEYAATRHARVVDKLMAVIKPLRGHAVLWETLTALIDADYNRNEAAKHLFVHRTTIDYRLQRIAELTGYHPATGRGAQMLTTALIVHDLNGSSVHHHSGGNPFHA